MMSQPLLAKIMIHLATVDQKSQPPVLRRVASKHFIVCIIELGYKAGIYLKVNLGLTLFQATQTQMLQESCLICLMLVTV